MRVCDVGDIVELYSGRERLTSGCIDDRRSKEPVANGGSLYEGASPLSGEAICWFWGYREGVSLEFLGTPDGNM